MQVVRARLYQDLASVNLQRIIVTLPTCLERFPAIVLDFSKRNIGGIQGATEHGIIATGRGSKERVLYYPSGSVRRQVRQRDDGIDTKCDPQKYRGQ
jgi:hypothetical protein